MMEPTASATPAVDEAADPRLESALGLKHNGLSDSLYESLVENLPIFVVRKDVEGRVTYVNPRLAELMGRTPAELVGKTDFDLFPHELARKYRADDLYVMQHDRLFVDVEENETHGERFFFEVRKTPIKSPTGQIVGTQAIFWDVTEKRRTEEALRHERFLLHALMDNVPDYIYFKDRESRYLRISRAMAENYGLADPREIIGRTDAEFTSPEHSGGTRTDELSIIQSGRGIIGKLEYQSLADGRETWNSTSKVPLRDDLGNIIGVLGVSRDVTKRKRAELDLARERDLLRTLMDRLPDLIYVKDAEGRYVVVNEAVRQLLGLESKDEVTGKTNAEFLTWEQAELEREDDDRVLKTGQPLIDREEQITDREGHPLWLLISKVPLRDPDGRVTGLVGIDRNITRLKRIQRELEMAKEAADAANRAKSDFLANVSHEIRTPMNAIIGMADLLLDTKVSDHQREYLTMIQQSGEALLSLINDILDFSKIEAGKLELEPDDFDLREGIGDAMKSLAIRAHGKGLELAFRVHPGVPSAVHGDLGRIRQIVMNLVGNAIKFTERGEVVLEVLPEGQTETEVKLRFRVTDTGIGIPPEKVAKIFEEFEQVDTSITRRYGGTGLGLSISSRLVELMGGEIRVESAPGVGSTFSFDVTLPLAKEVAQARRTAAEQLAVSETPVLIVDDNATNRRILSETLASWGMLPLTVASAPEALEQLELAKSEGRAFPLVVSDVNMPEMDGFELVERIQSEARCGSPTCIFLTSGTRADDRLRRIKASVAAHLMKPIKPSELFDAIVTALNLRAPLEKGAAQRELSAMHRSLRILLAEDNVVNQKLATAALESLGHEVIVAHHGREALERWRTEPFDLILMDVQMPQMDGLSATRAIREAEAEAKTETGGAHIKIIAMTAHAMKGDRDLCLEAGMDDYLPKPIRLAELAGKLREIFPEPPTAEPARGDTESTEPSTDDPVSRPLPASEKPLANPRVEADPPGHVNWQAALKSVNRNEALLRDVVQAFLDDVPRLLAAIRAALDANAPEEIRRHAHALKGSLLFLEPRAAIELAQDLEQRAPQETVVRLRPAVDALEEIVQAILAELQQRLRGDVPCPRS